MSFPTKSWQCQVFDCRVKQVMSENGVSGAWETIQAWKAVELEHHSFGFPRIEDSTKVS